MIDSVLKGTGNSRFLKSAVPTGTSWADALAMLQAGTFPIDFNGINTEGFQQVGTPLNKANLLKDATAAQIGLPPSTTPDGMFRALGNTGELHVWRKTVVADNEKPAGYTLGDVITNTDTWFSVDSSNGAVIHYASSVSVNNDGVASLISESTINVSRANPDSNLSIFDVCKGKFAYVSGGSYNTKSSIFFIPIDAVFYRKGTYSNNYIYADKEQRVNAHGIIPAGTTTTYPVSTNPNAYQEGDDAKPAGYTLGEVVTGSFSITPKNNGSQDTRWNYAADATGNITVSDDGVVSLSKVDSSVTTNGGNSNAVSTFSVLKGKYATFAYSMNAGNNKADLEGMVVFFPNDAVFSQVSDRVVVDRYQPVTGYAAIPAGTTIEYLGKLGDKARVQVVSYVGTGTYGESNPNSLTFDFVPKVVFILCWLNTNSQFCQGMLSPLLDYGFCMVSGYSGYGDCAYLMVKSSGNKITWTGKDSYYQLNYSGVKYYAIAIG